MHCGEESSGVVCFEFGAQALGGISLRVLSILDKVGSVVEIRDLSLYAACVWLVESRITSAKTTTPFTLSSDRYQ